MVYLSCENNENKQKEVGFGPFFKKNCKAKKYKKKIKVNGFKCKAIQASLAVWPVVDVIKLFLEEI